MVKVSKRKCIHSVLKDFVIIFFNASFKIESMLKMEAKVFQSKEIWVAWRIG